VGVATPEAVRLLTASLMADSDKEIRFVTMNCFKQPLLIYEQMDA
jgi:hypothetical protein